MIRILGNILAAVRMILICIFMALYLIILGIPILSYCRIKKDPGLGIYFTRILDRLIIFFGGIHVVSEGVDRVDGLKSCVYVGNHRSHADSAVAFYYLPGNLRFLIKAEAFKIPLVGFALRTMGMIPVNRSNREEAVKSVDLAIPEIRAGRSIIFFPEGTRSRTNELLPFKKGAFVLAIKAQVPLVPFTVIGAHEIVKPGSLILHGGTVKLIVHDPIDTTGYTMDQRDELTQKARDIISASLR